MGGHSVARLVLVITTIMEKVVKHERCRETGIDYQAHGKSTDQGRVINNQCLWAATMARQTGIWSVIWLKCTENGQWLPVISNSAKLFISIIASGLPLQ